MSDVEVTGKGSFITSSGELGSILIKNNFTEI